MKRTYSINIAGYPFTIDDNAYSLLNNYLQTIKNAFRETEYGDELSADIELRIAELLNEKILKGFQIIEYDDIETVIERIGQPEQISEEDIAIGYKKEGYNQLNNEKERISEEGNLNFDNQSGPATPPPFISQPPVIQKKLYRDPSNSMLGGVCSGIAWYFGWDVTFVRLIAVILIFLSASAVVLAYIIMWIVVPPAITPFQQMQMRGDPPTIRNIGKTVTDNGPVFTENYYNYPGGQENGQSFFKTCLKVLLICLAILSAPIILAALIILIVCIVIIFGSITSVFGDFPTQELEVLYESVSSYTFLLTIGIIIIFIVPLIAAIVYAFKSNKKRLTPTLWIFYLVIWIIGIGLVIFSGIKLNTLFNKINAYENEFTEISVINDDTELVEVVDSVTVEEQLFENPESPLLDSLNIPEQKDSARLSINIEETTGQ